MGIVARDDDAALTPPHLLTRIRRPPDPGGCATPCGHAVKGRTDMEFYSVNGSGNNSDKPGLNAAGSDFTRLGEAHFADGISSLVDGPNPRSISNIVVGQGDPTIPNPDGLSGMLYAWGQFIDHDLDLSRNDGVTHIDVAIPSGDAFFAAGSFLPMTRAVIDPAT